MQGSQQNAGRCRSTRPSFQPGSWAAAKGQRILTSFSAALQSAGHAVVRGERELQSLQLASRSSLRKMASTSEPRHDSASRPRPAAGQAVHRQPARNDAMIMDGKSWQQTLQSVRAIDHSHPMWAGLPSQAQ